MNIGCISIIREYNKLKKKNNNKKLQKIFIEIK